MIIFDMEWNRGYDGKALDEILQIGAVRLDHLGGRILDCFDTYIRPQVHKKLNKVSKLLPEIQRSLNSNVDFPTAMRDFLDWCGNETEYAAWGSDEIENLNRSCAYWGVEPLRVEQVYDLQLRFSALLGVGHAMALSTAVEYCGIPEPYEYHNALYDALYTAMVGEVMGAWTLQLQLRSYAEIGSAPKRRRRKETPRQEPLPPEQRQQMLASLTTEPFAAKKARSCGPMHSSREILNSRCARHPHCPICGRRGNVAFWFTQDQRHYYNAFACPEHGRFLCRLMLVQRQETGEWLGMLSVPAPDPQELEAFEGAMRFQPYRCRSNPGYRKKRS